MPDAPRKAMISACLILALVVASRRPAIPQRPGEEDRGPMRFILRMIIILAVTAGLYVAADIAVG